MGTHVHSMGHDHGAHDHGAHDHGADMASAVLNATMSMILSNATGTGMGHNTDHSMHDMTGMNHSMHDMTGMGMNHSAHGGMDMNHSTHHGMGMNHSMHNVTGMGMNHSEHHGVDHGTEGHAGHSMLMYFNFQLPIHVLFFGWELTNQEQLAVACVAWLLLAIAHEGLKSLREYILIRSARSERKYLLKARKNSPEGSDDSVYERSCVQKIFCGWHILLSLLQIIQTTLGMFLMLVYMTFNVYLALSVSLGSGVGYWLFAWNKRSVGQFDDDHCV